MSVWEALVELDRARPRRGEQLTRGIASMPAELAAPAQLNHYAREHWCVENRYIGHATSRFARTCPSYAPALLLGPWPASAT